MWSFSGMYFFLDDHLSMDDHSDSGWVKYSQVPIIKSDSWGQRGVWIHSYHDHPDTRGVWMSKSLGIVKAIYLNKTLLHPRSLTASLPLKNDGWKTFSFPFGIVNFQGRTVKLPASIFFQDQIAFFGFIFWWGGLGDWNPHYKCGL